MLHLPASLIERPAEEPALPVSIWVLSAREPVSPSRMTRSQGIAPRSISATRLPWLPSYVTRPRPKGPLARLIPAPIPRGYASMSDDVPRHNDFASCSTHAAPSAQRSHPVA